MREGEELRDGWSDSRSKSVFQRIATCITFWVKPSVVIPISRDVVGLRNASTV